MFQQELPRHQHKVTPRAPYVASHTKEVFKAATSDAENAEEREPWQRTTLATVPSDNPSLGEGLTPSLKRGTPGRLSQWI